MDLFDSYTAAARSMRRCCVATLNKATDVHPSARALLKTEPEKGGGIKATLHCPECKTTTVIHADGRAVRVENAPVSSS